jgi:hypothetical protein
MKPSKYIPTSALLREAADHLNDETTIGSLASDIGDRAFGICILIFALPNCIPFPMPGVSAITAMPMLYFSIQMMLGRQSLWMPKRIANRSVSPQIMRRVLNYCIPVIVRIEKLFKPRMDRFMQPRALQFSGFVLTMLALLIAPPIPFGNMVPAIAVVFICIACIEHDGLLVLAGWLSSLLAIAYVTALIYFGVQVLHWLAHLWASLPQ